MSYELQVTSSDVRVRVQIHGFKKITSTSYEFKFTRYQIISASFEIKSTSCSIKTTSSIVIMRERRENYEFKIANFRF